MLLTVVVADPQRAAAMRDGLPTPGRVLRYTTGNLASVFESIRANQPGLIVLDAVFLNTPPGRSFLDRIEQLHLPRVVLQAAMFEKGHWTMGSIVQQEPAPAPIAGPERVVAGVDTRRVPRFLAQNIAQALAEGSAIRIVDLSVLGAQMISYPILRPDQRIKLRLPDDRGMLDLAASVAWSTFEKPAQAASPHFRVGIEFKDAVREALDDYCRRHCGQDPATGRER